MQAKIRVSYISYFSYCCVNIYTYMAELVLIKPYLNKLISFDIMSVAVV